MNVDAIAAAASALIGEKWIGVPTATVGASTVVVVAPAASVNIPEQFSRPWSICSMAWLIFVKSVLFRPGT